MLFLANLSGILLSLTSAVVWGMGDFTGGYATRRASSFQVLTLSAFSGLLMLAGAALLRQESFPSLAGTVWAMLGGVAGGIGIAALYRGLSTGRAASVAPTAAVVGAVLPVIFGVFTAGLPGPTKLVGFVLAMVGIWLVSRTGAEPAVEDHPGNRGRPFFSPELLLACLAGVGFGGFFIFLGLVDKGKIFTPLIVTRSLTLVTGLVLMYRSRLPIPRLAAHPYALLAGVLDAGGNLFYILAHQFTRLDIAAVIASFYPASTVVLSRLVLKERVAPAQWLGVALCLAAIALITV